MTNNALFEKTDRPPKLKPLTAEFVSKINTYKHTVYHLFNACLILANIWKISSFSTAAHDINLVYAAAVMG